MPTVMPTVMPTSMSKVWPFAPIVRVCPHGSESTSTRAVMDDVPTGEEAPCINDDTTGIALRGSETVTVTLARKFKGWSLTPHRPTPERRCAQAASFPGARSYRTCDKGSKAPRTEGAGSEQ